MLAIVALSVFIAETALMFLFDALPPLSPVWGSLLDSTLLIIIISPMLYFFLFRPLRRTSELKSLVDNLNTEISNRKKLEDALKQSREQYRFLVDNINMGIAHIDVNYKVVTANRFHGKMLNRQPKEYVGKYCFMEFEKRDAICPHCPGRKAMVSGDPEETENEGVMDDGTRVSVNIKAFPVFGPDGQPTGFIEVVEDISQRKKAEETQAHLMEEINRAREELEEANAQLKEKVGSLEKFQRLIIGREERILQLKKKVKELEGEKAED